MPSNELVAGGSPRYQQLIEALVMEIADGRYPVGSMLPPEPRLRERFQVSRHTVREAVRRLSEMGLVSKHQGVGTIVKARRVDSRFVASLSSLQELMQYTQQTRLKRLGERWVDASADLAAMLSCAPGTRWYEFDACRYPADSREPLAHMRIYVDARYDGIRSRLGDGNVWVFGLLEELYGERIVEVRQEVGSIPMPAQSARVLGVKARSPALQVMRYYFADGGRLLSMSLNIYPAGRFRFSTSWRLAPSSASGE